MKAIIKITSLFLLLSITLATAQQPNVVGIVGANLKFSDTVNLPNNEKEQTLIKSSFTGLYGENLLGQCDNTLQNVKSTINSTASGRRTVSDGGSFLQTLDYSLSLSVSVYGSRPYYIGDTIRFFLDSCVGIFIYHGVAQQQQGNISISRQYGERDTFHLRDALQRLSYLKTYDSLVLLNASFREFHFSATNNFVFSGFNYDRMSELLTINIDNPSGWYFDEAYKYKFISGPIHGPITVSHYQQLDNKFAFKDKTLIGNSQKSFFNVAADGSEASIMTFKRTNEMDKEVFKRLYARIEEDPMAAKPFDYGQFSLLYRDDDSVAFRYKHPEHLTTGANPYKTIQMGIRNPTENCPLTLIRIHVYRASVLMVHGLWSNGSAFSKMEDFLKSQVNKEYVNWQTYKVDYCATNDSYFCTNSPQVFDGIDKLIRYGIANSCAVGKVDVVCHSMGGILARLYIQSPSYENDIRKLITTNTPHYGSPIADFVMEHSTVPNAICELWKRFNKCKGTCDDGAINDLRMEGSAIRNLNTGNFSRKIAVHSIATTRDLADVQGVLNRTDILESILGSDWFAPFRIMFGFADIAKSIGCVGNDLFDNEQNDCIVGLRSQLGGLTGSHVTRVINQMHMGAQENQDVIVAVRSLLNTPPNSDKFSNYGYQPRPAGYGYSLNIAECIEEAQARVFSIDQLSKINIEVSQSPVSGSSNQNIRITGEGPPNISTLLLLLEIDINHTIYGRKQGSSAVFDVDMPFNSFGNKGITMVGYDFNNRKLVYGKSTVTIQPLSSIIAIHIDPAEVYVQKDKSTPLRIIGTDVNNKAYDLTNLAGVDFQFDNNYARRDGGGVFGVNLGSDTLKVSFNGKSSEKIPINVLDCRNVATIPIELLSFTGKAHKGRNQLNWQTATEQNNKGFHIERSSDGQSWQSIGWVSGKGNSSSIVVYELFDESPLNISYYRLRQVDFDEKPTISKAITLVQWSDNEIIIYPNPSSDALNITTSEALIGKEYTVTNTLGVSVLSGVIKDKSMALSIKNMPNGVYFLHILGTTTATKFIKE